MKKLLSLCFLAGFLFLVSCGDDENNVATDCRLTSFDGLDDFGRLGLNYGSDGRISSVTSTINESGFPLTLTLTATYNGNNLVRLSANIISFSFTYDASGRVTRTDFNFDGEVERTEYSYNSNGQLSRVTYFDNFEPDVFLAYSHIDYTYPNTTSRNPSTATEFSYDGETAFETGTSELEYDDKRSFVSSAPIIGAMFGFFGENNLIRETHTGLSTSYVVTYIYQYNAQGYPISGIEQYDDDDDPFSFSMTYDCQ